MPVFIQGENRKISAESAQAEEIYRSRSKTINHYRYHLAESFITTKRINLHLECNNDKVKCFDKLFLIMSTVCCRLSLVIQADIERDMALKSKDNAPGFRRLGSFV